MPLSLRGGRDKLIWQHSRCGQYLTGSGYKSAKEMKKNGELRGRACGETSSLDGVLSVWRELWKLKLAPRVKLFMWKCLHNILPTREFHLHFTETGFGLRLFGLSRLWEDSRAVSKNGGHAATEGRRTP
ncbi:hypothetical protein LIER_14891 [Lithospermum erythrorhizon]|uniref:Reverse transcriptase zinc-binding domain-containing protein n=1 Tax=Lithospermum erythrorhizon TaxID=34254 RepID=A0AAV3Q3Y9_LITER